MFNPHDLIKGLRSTQASEVHIPYEAVVQIVGEEIAEELAVNISGFHQTPHKPKMASKEAIAKAEMRKPYRLATYDRADLVDVIDELIEENGSLENLLGVVEDRRSTLQKVRDKLSTNIPFPFPQEKEEVSDGE